MRLTGKVALVTNCARYMGPAVTEEFAREGATLALHDGDLAAADADFFVGQVIPFAGGSVT